MRFRALSVALLLPFAAAAQTTPHRGAGSAAFHPDRLARIDSMVLRMVASGEIPGAVVMLVRDGKVVYHKALGYRDVSTREPQRTNDIFRIASQTKAITSLAVMMLWEEGRFQLDDPIGKYLPEFEKQSVLTKFNPSDSSYESKPTRRRITIRQLLTHTSGLDYAQIGSDEFNAIYSKAGVTAGIGNAPDVLADKMRILATLPLKHEPGEHFTYGLSIDVLGRLVEVLSGMTLDQFFHKRIFQPLKMRDTWFYLPVDKQNRLVALHREKDGKLEAMHDSIDGASPDFPAHTGTYFSGGSGLSSTTADYARFLQLFLNDGELDGVRLLGRKTIEMMLTDQIPSLDFPFGLGFALETAENDYRSPLTVGSFEWGGAFNTTYWADPKERLIGLIFTNMYGASQSLGDRFKTLVYAALK